MHYFWDHPMTLRPPSWDGVGWGGKEWEGQTSCLVTMKDRRMEGAGEGGCSSRVTRRPPGTG